MIFTPSKSSEFNAHIIPAFSNYQQNQSEVASQNCMRTGFHFRCVQKFSITALFSQLNTYVLYVINSLLSILYSILTSSVNEMEVSLS